MYCSTCGVSVAQGLSFCNYCGAKLSGQDSGPPKIRPESLIFAILAIFVFGMGAISLFTLILKNGLNLHNDEVLLFALVPFLVMLMLEFVFVRLLLRNTRGDGEAAAKVKLTGHTTKELDAAHARALPEPLGSVTENTTRAFDPIYTRRDSK
jgi:hypothetical protein